MFRGDLLLGPSPNWFLNNAIDSRSEGKLFVTGAFRALLVYHIPSEGGLPRVLKCISLGSEKASLVCLHPRAAEADYGHTVTCVTDSQAVKLFSIHSGELLTHHKEHQNWTVNGICWGSVGGEEVVVTVSNGGRMVVWQARHNVTRVHSLAYSSLTAIDTSPKNPGQAVVAADEIILLLSLKDGSVLTQFRGHDAPIYCLRLYKGNDSIVTVAEQPETNSRAEALKAAGRKSNGQSPKSDIKSTSESVSSGPFVASADYSRNIFVWDLSAKRYITKTTVPLNISGFNKKMVGKDKAMGNQHISLAWYNGELYSSTTRGELLHWTLWQGGAKYNVIHHLHNRAIYNLAMIDDVAITSGQDRFIHGYDLKKSCQVFQVPTLGACATTFAFCPHDVYRLAVGTQENMIRVLNFNSHLPLGTQTVYQNIKGKILSLAWHPAQEDRLLFGTGSGQVGWADISNGSVTPFAYYHQKSVYKVEWGPPVNQEKSGLSDGWYAYSLGDRDIMIRNTANPMADAIELQTLFPETETGKPNKDTTEFSFSPDYKFLALGGNDGQVRVYDSSNLQLVVNLVGVRKSIQHLLWKPPNDSGISYFLAVASNENEIYVFNLKEHLSGEKEQVVTQATKELRGHSSRVVWLSWSPHKDNILASASYDHTVQLWDTNTGEQIANYGGHLQRVFRVEFCPSDPDLLYSFAEENNIHQWRSSQLTCKTSKESNTIVKQYRPKKVKDSTPPTDSSTSTTTKKQGERKEKETSNGTSTFGSNKKGGHKSFFPKLHTAFSHKKSFTQIMLLHLLALRVNEDAKNKEEEDCGIDEDLEDDQEEESGSGELQGTSLLSSIEEASKKYSYLVDKEKDQASPEEFAYALNMFGSSEAMDNILKAEIAEHETKENYVNAGLMHCWRATLNDHIRDAARRKKLTPFLVASAPQVSIKMWQFASEAYAEQLIEEGDAITGASYLVNINKVEEAVDVLLKHHHYREAMAIAKSRLFYTKEVLEKVASKWASYAIFEGTFDLAALLHLSNNRLEEAARTMSRRADSGSLFVSAQLYAAAGKTDMVKSVGLLALREASVRHEVSRIEPYLQDLPQLGWFRAVALCHNTFLKLLDQVSREGNSSYLAERKHSTHGLLSDAEQSGDKEVENVLAKKQGSEDPHQNGLSNKSEELSATDSSELPLQVSLLSQVKECWAQQSITDEIFPQLYETIKNSFSTQQMPTSVKQLWFLVSVAVCEMLMCPTEENWEQHMSAALSYVVSWGRSDQIFHLTHVLLPKGPSELTTLEYKFKDLELENLTPAVKLLRHMYHVSEISIIYDHLETVKTSLNAGNVTESDASLDCKESENILNGSSNEAPVVEYIEKSDPPVGDAATESTKSQSSQKDKVQGEVEFLVGKEPLSVYHLPQSSSELLSVLNHHIDHLDKNHKALEDLMGLSSHVYSYPEKSVVNIILKLQENGVIKAEDSRILLHNVSIFTKDAQ